MTLGRTTAGKRVTGCCTSWIGSSRSLGSAMDKHYTTIPATLSHYRLPAPLLRQTAQMLRGTGRGVREAVALWQGRIVDDATAAFTKLVIPKQLAGELHFNVPLQDRLRLIQEVSAQGEFILAQIHTHPREAFHSKADDQM